MIESIRLPYCCGNKPLDVTLRSSGGLRPQNIVNRDNQGCQDFPCHLPHNPPVELRLSFPRGDPSGNSLLSPGPCSGATFVSTIFTIYDPECSDDVDQAYRQSVVALGVQVEGGVGSSHECTWVCYFERLPEEQSSEEEWSEEEGSEEEESGEEKNFCPTYEDGCWGSLLRF